MKLQLLISEDQDEYELRDFYVEDSEIKGYYVADYTEIDGSKVKCLNILLSSGLYTVKTNQDLIHYLTKKFKQVTNKVIMTNEIIESYYKKANSFCNLLRLVLVIGIVLILINL